MNRNHVHIGNGTAVRTHADGRAERVEYVNVTYETRDAIACVRRYADGRIERSVRCEHVDAFPPRYAEMDSLASRLTGEFWPDREAFRVWQAE